MANPTTDDDVPKLPRGGGFKLSSPQIFRILLTAALLVALIVMTKPCANGVSKFVMGFGSGSGSGSGSGAGSGSAQPDPYEHLSGNMSEAEIKAAMERAKQKNRDRVNTQEGITPSSDGSAGGANTGSASAGSANGSANAGGVNATGSANAGSAASMPFKPTATFQRITPPPAGSNSPPPAP
ncbi:MAG: hypothetical protein QM831_45930 [Kofleriaceae bacterium]